MKSILLILSLIFSFSASFASTNASAENCSMKIQGVDGWPWKVAQPWQNVQGIWKLSGDKGDIYFKFRITATMGNRKIIAIDKILDGNCAKPVASGGGYISVNEERNTIRAVISEKNLRYQLKLAVFDTDDLSNELKSDAQACGEQVIGISVMEVIGRSGGGQSGSNYDGFALTQENENMMLKKVSDSLDSICKKPAGH